MRPATPSNLELEAACREAAELRARAKAEKLKRARALLAEGLSAEAVSKRVHLAHTTVRKLQRGTP